MKRLEEGEEEGNCVPESRHVCVCTRVCVCGGRHALAGFSITQLPLIFNCFLRLAHSSTSHSANRKEEEGLPSRGEGKRDGDGEEEEGQSVKEGWGRRRGDKDREGK